MMTMSDTALRELASAIQWVLAENERLTKELKNARCGGYNKKKLTPTDVQSIYHLRRQGLSVKEIADIYDVNKSTISRTLKGVYHK